ITNGTFITTDSGGAGRAGDLRLTASSVHVDNAVIGSRPFASGDGGTVLVQVGTLTLTGGAQIDIDSSGAGRGGQLWVSATDASSISGQNSRGASSALSSNTFGTGRAGNLFVSAPRMEMAGGVIEAASGPASRGDAGDIRVEVGTLVLTDGAQIGTFTR